MDNKYIFICRNGKTTYEHIEVAEQMLGRKLNGDECVHHIDRCRSNNNPGNLMVFATKADHARYHQGIQAHKVGDVWVTDPVVHKHICPNCNKVFEDIRRDAKYCSVKCQREGNRKIPVNIDQMVEDIKEYHGNMTRLSHKYGVTANAIVKTLKRNNLPYHSSDYK